MKRNLPLVLALLCLFSGLLLAQQRPLSEIAAELEKLAAELRQAVPTPPSETIVKAGDSLSMALALAETGATLVLEDGAVFTCNCSVSKKVTIRGKGVIVTANGAPALTVTGPDVVLSDFAVRPSGVQNVNDLVVLRGERTRLTDIVVEGNGATKRGIQANGVDMVLTRVRVSNIRQKGTESQALAIWDGSGLTIRDSYLQGASQSFLSGGAAPTVPNHVPADILIEGSTLTRDVAWRGGGYAVKTGFELKSARRVIVRDSIIEHVWVDGQTGAGVTLTPSQYGNSPETVVEGVRFERVKVLDVGLGVNLVGFTQHTDPLRQTLRAHDIRFLDCQFVISKAANGGHGSLIQAGLEPADVRFENNVITQDGTAFIRTTDTKPIAGLVFTGNRVSVTGTYGIYTPTNATGLTGIRGANFGAFFPGGVISGNTFTTAHATFKANFSSNTYQ